MNIKIVIIISLILNILLASLSILLIMRIIRTPILVAPHDRFVISNTAGAIKKTDYPQFNGYIEPFDAQRGEMETVEISLLCIIPVNQVFIIVKGDTITSKPHQLELISGSTTNGTWKGSWKAEDTYKKYYILQFQMFLKNKSQYKMEMRFRTPINLLKILQ